MFFRRKKKKEDPEKNRSTVDKIVMGAIIGTAVGSVIGLAVAPKKGKETRQMLKETYSNQKERISNYEKDIKEIGQLARETTVGVFTLAKNFFLGGPRKSPPKDIREHKDLRQIPNEMEIHDLLENSED